MPRNKDLEWKKRYIGYSKTHEKTIKRCRSLTGALLALLLRLLAFEKHLQNNIILSYQNAMIKTLISIKKVYKQQKRLRASITKERASRVGSNFGKQKEWYHLKKTKLKPNPAKSSGSSLASILLIH